MNTTPHSTPDVPVSSSFFRRVSWGAIFAGAVVALATQALLALLGMAVGLAALQPADPSGVGIGVGIWWIISSLIALFVGGWIGGRLAGLPDRGDGMLHGFVIWGAATLFSVFLVTTAIGSVVSGTMAAVGQTMQVAGQTAGSAASGATTVAKQVFEDELGSQPFEEIYNELEGVLTGPNAEQVRQELRDLLNTARSSDITSPAFRQELEDFMVNTAGVEQSRAERLVDRAIQGYQQFTRNLQQFGNTVEQKTEEAADAVASASFWCFFALLLGAGAGGWGGSVGACSRTEARPERPVTSSRR